MRKFSFNFKNPFVKKEEPTRGASFERSKRAKGGSERSYSSGVSAPKGMQAEKQRLILILAITVILPPVGIMILWRGGFLPIPHRAVVTFAAFWIMVLYFSWMIPESEPGMIQAQMKRPTAVTQYSSSSAGNQADGAAEN